MYKKKFLLGILVLLFGFIQAQITLYTPDLPNGGEGFTIAYDTVTNTNPGNSSSIAQNWNFTSLYTHNIRYVIYSSLTKYQIYDSVFPEAELYSFGPGELYGGLSGAAPTNNMAWGYLFLSSDTNGLQVAGFRGDYQTEHGNILETPQELLLDIPTSLDTFRLDTARWQNEYAVNPLDYDTIYVNKTIKQLACDAFGSLTINLGVYDVLRIKENAIVYDSVYIYDGTTLLSAIELNKDTVINYYFWAKSIGYPVAIIHANAQNQVLSTEFIQAQYQTHSIKGKLVSTDGFTPITEANVSLIQKDSWNHLFNINEVVSVTDSGYFQFANNIGEFILYADPDFNIYPYHIPTYYGDSIHWAQAKLLQTTSDTAIVIRLQNDSAFINMNGVGYISGSVKEAAKNYTSAADNIKVALEKNPGGATAVVSNTDNDGDYSFSDLETGNYTVKVEIAGLVMDSVYNVDITTANYIYNDLDYFYDTTSIFINPSQFIVNPKPTINQFEIFPNPVCKNDVILISKQINNTGLIKISDINGRILYQEKISAKKKQRKIQLQNLNAGVYFVSVSFDNNFIDIKKLIVLE